MKSAKLREAWRVMCVAAVMSVDLDAAAIGLTRGTPATLSGTLGDVQVNYVDDSVSLSRYLDGSGIVALPGPDSYVPATRVQYDVLNMPGNESIFEYQVEIDPEAEVLAALAPGGFFDGSGSLSQYWNGSSHAVVFDSGYGTYDYDLDFGGEWIVDYAPNSVTWRHIGNGFFPGTATGATEFGFVPTFALYFEAGTPLALRPAAAFGHASEARGEVLSAGAVPLVGDHDGSGVVDQGDLNLVLLNWGQDVSQALPAGWSGTRPSGIVDQQELSAVLLGWGNMAMTAQATGPTAVAEPSTGVLALVLIAVVIVVNRPTGRPTGAVRNQQANPGRPPFAKD